MPPPLKALLNSAAVDRCPIVAAGVDGDGQPQLAYYGTLQLLDDGRLGWWVRKPEHLLERIAGNPRMTFIYWNVTERVMLKLFGTASVTHEVADRDVIFTGSPEAEQAIDPDRLGTAFVADLHLMTGFAGGVEVRIEAA